MSSKVFVLRQSHKTSQHGDEMRSWPFISLVHDGLFWHIYTWMEQPLTTMWIIPAVCILEINLNIDIVHVHCLLLWYYNGWLSNLWAPVKVSLLISDCILRNDLTRLLFNAPVFNDFSAEIIFAFTSHEICGVSNLDLGHFIKEKADNQWNVDQVKWSWRFLLLVGAS